MFYKNIKAEASFQRVKPAADDKALNDVTNLLNKYSCKLS
jgi:hypothetical protein